MRSILFFVRKELLQIFRNKAMLPLLFVMPIIQLLILSHVATNEVKNLHLGVSNLSHGVLSQRLIDKMISSGYFVFPGQSAKSGLPDASELQKPDDIKLALDADQVDLILVIPEDFEQNLRKGESTEIQLLVNAINSMKAGVVTTYANSIIMDYQRELQQEGKIPIDKGAIQVALPQIEIRYSHWFNPELDYKTFMVPGILALLVSMLTLLLGAMNVVREREIGTIEQIEVSPVKTPVFILGKLLPLLIIGLAELSIGILVAKLVFHTPMEGPLLLLYAFAALTIVAMLSLGLLISNITETQQQAMFIAWFFMIIFVLMSGLFTPIESMPPWAQKLTYANPIAQLVSIVRLNLLKGSGWTDVWPYFRLMLSLDLIYGLLAMAMFKKRSN